MLWCADSRAYCPFRGRCCVVLVSIPALSQQLHESLWVCAAASPEAQAGLIPPPLGSPSLLVRRDASTCDVVSHTHCTCYTS